MTEQSTDHAPRILVISIAFPPKFDSEALQVEKIMGELVAAGGFRLNVLTADRYTTRNMPFSPTMRDFKSDCEMYVELPIKENRYITKALSMIGALHLPDSKAGIHRHGLAAIRTRLPEPDLIYARSFPPSSSVLAMKLAKAWQKPWIMHLSDPWHLSPLLHYKPLERIYSQIVERRCLKCASAISFTTPQTLALYARHYPEFEDKFFLTHNSVPETDLRHTSREVAPGNLLTIVHTGVLNKDRDPKFLLQSLRELFARKPSLRGKIRLRICGPTDRYVSRLMTEYADVVEHAGIIRTPDEFTAFIDSADILLAVDMRIYQADRDVYLISKLLDYAAKRQKILCITNPNSPAQEFVNEVKGQPIAWADSEALQHFLEQAQWAKQTGDVNFFATAPLPKRFTSAVVADGLRAIIARLL